MGNHVNKIVLTMGAVVLLTACATKRYPIATQFSAAEAQALDCRELGLELAKAEETRTKIEKHQALIGDQLQDFLEISASETRWLKVRQTAHCKNA